MISCYLTPLKPLSALVEIDWIKMADSMGLSSMSLHYSTSPRAQYPNYTSFTPTWDGQLASSSFSKSITLKFNGGALQESTKS